MEATNYCIYYSIYLVYTLADSGVQYYQKQIYPALQQYVRNAWQQKQEYNMIKSKQEEWVTSLLADAFISRLSASACSFKEAGRVDPMTSLKFCTITTIMQPVSRLSRIKRIDEQSETGQEDGKWLLGGVRGQRGWGAVMGTGGRGA